MNISDSELQRLNAVMLNKKLTVSEIIDFIEENIKSEIDLTSELKLIVYYSKNYDEAIACGKYRFVNQGINADNFPVPKEKISIGIEEVNAKLFDFGISVSRETAINRMDKAGYYAGNPMELLALGAAYPDLQLKYRIIALETIHHLSDGNCFVPQLFGSGCSRELSVYYFDGGYFPDRYLGIRKREL